MGCSPLGRGESDTTERLHFFLFQENRPSALVILESDLCFLYTVVPPFQDPCGYLNPRMLKSSMHDGYRSGRSVCGMQTLYITVLRSAPKRPIAFELFSSLRTMPSWSESRLQSSFPEGKERPGGWEIQSLGLRSMKNWV